VIDADNAATYFNGSRMNVGVILGPSSHGLTDVDLDCTEARDIASYILPRTGAIFGRPSSRAAHRLYYTDLSVNADKAVLAFNDPATNERLLELRIGGASGAQTVFPGSTHETGEKITWEENGEPASVDNDDLYCLVHDLAAYSLIARYWPKQAGSRHECALMLGGFLARAGKDPQEIKVAAEAIARAASDKEWRNRRAAAEDAAKAFHAGKHAYGLTSMRKQFGNAVADQVAEWLGYDGGSEQQEESPTPESEELPPLPFIKMSNWDNEPVPEQEWAVPDRIPLGQTTLFTGEGGYGKSTVQLHLCAAHALGLGWLNTLPEPGPAVFFEAEDGEKIIHRRLAAIATHYGVRFEDMIRGGLHVVSLFGRDTVLATPARNGQGRTDAPLRPIAASGWRHQTENDRHCVVRQRVCWQRNRSHPNPAIHRTAKPHRRNGEWFSGVDQPSQLDRHQYRHRPVGVHPMAQRRACPFLSQRHQSRSWRATRQRPARIGIQEKPIRPDVRKYRAALPQWPVLAREGRFRPR
jgi:hypothetical protein